MIAFQIGVSAQLVQIPFHNLHGLVRLLLYVHDLLARLHLLLLHAWLLLHLLLLHAWLLLLLLGILPIRIV